MRLPERQRDLISPANPCGFPCVALGVERLALPREFAPCVKYGRDLERAFSPLPLICVVLVARQPGAGRLVPPREFIFWRDPLFRLLFLQELGLRNPLFTWVAFALSLRAHTCSQCC